MIKKFCSGFTIIEFLLAFVILVIALIGGSTFFYANSRNIKKANTMRLATWSIVEKLESIRAMDYSSIQNGTTTEQITIGNIQAQRITSISEDTSIYFKTVIVQVSWDTNNISVSTMITRP